MSDKIWRFSLDTFPNHAPRVFARLCEAVLTEAVEELGARWLPYAKAMTPVGGILTPHDKHPGQMKRSWSWKQSKRGHKRLSNATPYGLIIDRGRKKGVTPIGAAKRVRLPRWERSKPNKRARMLGSVQAPKGITRPVWQRLNKSERAIISKIAIKKAEASVPATGGA